MHDKLHYTGSECKRIINVCWHNWDLQWAPLELSAFVPCSIKVVWIIKTGPSIIFSLNKFNKTKKNDLLHGEQENHRRMSFINGLKTLFRGLQVQTVISHLGRVHLQLTAEQRQWFLWTPHWTADIKTEMEILELDLCDGFPWGWERDYHNVAIALVWTFSVERRLITKVSGTSMCDSVFAADLLYLLFFSPLSGAGALTQNEIIVRH